MTASNFMTHVKFLLDNSQEFGLVELYRTLNNKLGDSQFCEDFLRLMVNDIMLEDAPSVDVLVHILNALKPIKDRLESWRIFVYVSRIVMIDRLGEKDADVLMRVAE